MKKLLSIAVLGLVSASALLAGGCASGGDRPYSLTGNASEQPKSPHQIFLEHPQWVRRK